MPNLRNSSTSNILFLSCNICEKSVSDKDDAIQCDICQTWIHLKCKKLYHIDYTSLQGSSDPWFVFTAVAQSFLLDFWLTYIFHQLHYIVGMC